LADSLTGQGFAEFPSGPREAVCISDHIFNGGDKPTAILIGEGEGGEKLNDIPAGAGNLGEDFVAG